VEKRPFCVASAFSFAHLEVPAILRTSDMCSVVASFSKLTPQEQDIAPNDQAENVRAPFDDRATIEELIEGNAQWPL
jgi:uncharacterized UBP type Zn finger protein